jgi:hypothetical protein
MIHWVIRWYFNLLLDVRTVVQDRDQFFVAAVAERREVCLTIAVIDVDGRAVFVLDHCTC